MIGEPGARAPGRDEQTAYLALGSNLGDRLAFLQAAVAGLEAAPGIAVTAVSRVFETAPVGGPEQGPYLNAVVALRTRLRPAELLGLPGGSLIFQGTDPSCSSGDGAGSSGGNS